MTLFFFLLFIVIGTGLIGFFASRQSQKSGEDYFLASQGVSPYLLAFSSTASRYSGFMFIGLMSLAYTKGTLVIWWSLGLLLGSFLVYAPAVFQLQKTNVGGWALSLAELITFWGGENRVWLRRLIGVATIFFFTIYAAAQLKAGGKVFESAFHLPAYIGVLLSALIILFYCWSGGIRASIWTDFFQAWMMALSLIFILVVSVVRAGGVGELVDQFIKTAPGTQEVALLPQNLSIGGVPGFVLFMLGALSLGACVLGNPHIVIRAMALKTAKDAKRFIIANYIFELFLIFLFVTVGLLTRVILADVELFDPELSLIWSAEKLLPPALLGLFVAGVFSSTLSTADSQIISCSSSLMRDLPEPPRDSIKVAKMGTIVITLIATGVAFFAKSDVFSLVIFAYSGLGVSIGSVLILRLLRVNIPEWGAIFMLLFGGGTIFVWNSSGLSSYIDRSLAGWVVVFVVFAAVKIFLRFYSPSRS